MIATVTWIVGSALLSYDLSHFANYDATYGSHGAATGLMIWMWMSTVRRGAAMTDTVGEAK